MIALLEKQTVNTEITLSCSAFKTFKHIMIVCVVHQDLSHENIDVKLVEMRG